jgi:hypothetical protein
LPKGKEGKQRENLDSDSPARFVDVMLVTMDTGTVVTFLFASITDLFFAVAMLSSRGNFSVDRDRRVLTFPSGFTGRFDL